MRSRYFRADSLVLRFHLLLQVSRMLTGNVEIIGFFYVSENFEKIKPVESQLHSIVKSIASQRKTAAVRRHTNTRYFILEISSSNKR